VEHRGGQALLSSSVAMARTHNFPHNLMLLPRIARTTPRAGQNYGEFVVGLPLRIGEASPASTVGYLELTLQLYRLG